MHELETKIARRNVARFVVGYLKERDDADLLSHLSAAFDMDVRGLCNTPAGVLFVVAQMTDSQAVRLYRDLLELTADAELEEMAADKFGG